MDQGTQQAVAKGAAGTAASIAALGMTFQEWLQFGIVVMTFVWWAWLLFDKVRERRERRRKKR